jgi:hypothetical protein
MSVTQSNYTGQFTLSTTTCSGIVSVTPAKGAGPFTFSALKAGTCTYTIAGSGAKIALPITVTTTTVQGS